MATCAVCGGELGVRRVGRRWCSPRCHFEETWGGKPSYEELLREVRDLRKQRGDRVNRRVKDDVRRLFVDPKSYESLWYQREVLKR